MKSSARPAVSQSREVVPSDPRPRIVEAVQSGELTRHSCWNDLDVLSSHTTIDGIEVDPESIQIQDNKFSGSLNIYVVLMYGKGEDSFQNSDGFPGKFHGHIEDDKVIVEDITVDTSSFYG